MNITPLVAESLGTRSMATFVETKSCSILLDPGASIAKIRYSLGPHDIEKWCLQKHLERIALYARVSDLIVITHYHQDHFIQNNPQIYKDKILLLKNPNQDINAKQRSVAFEFIRSIEGYPKEIHYIDGRMWQYRNIFFSFSPAFPHGIQQNDETIIMVSIREENDVFVFSSDTQGIVHEEVFGFIKIARPTYLYLDGPLTYLHGNPSLKRALEDTQIALKEILHFKEIQHIIVDHHLLRDKEWQTFIGSVKSIATTQGIPVQTVAEYRGDIINQLEARRKFLYQDELLNEKSL